MRHTVLLLIGLSMITGVPLPVDDAVAMPVGVFDVSAQGLLRSVGPPLVVTSPEGSYQLEIAPRKGGFEYILADLTLRRGDVTLGLLHDVAGNAFFVSENGGVIVLDAAETQSLASALTIYDAVGHALFTRKIFAPVNASISTDGQSFACAGTEGVIVLDLGLLTEDVYPAMDLFAVGPRGRLAGVRLNDSDRWDLILYDGSEESLTFSMDSRPRRLAFTLDGSAVLLVGSRSLLRVAPPSLEPTVLFTSQDGAELMDLRVTATGILLGLRRIAGGYTAGEMVLLDEEGRVLGREGGPSLRIPWEGNVPPVTTGIPWPIRPDSQHPVGNSYGEYQNYGGSPYPHPGIDVMGSPGQPVYSVRSGVVKAILTTAGEWHWRVAIGDSVTAGTCKGYLYAHLLQSSIPVHVGDLIMSGQYIGDLVEWPIYGFTHTHFARIQDSGATWDGTWLNTENPHLTITNQSETDRPVFEPARGNDLLAFCNNQTSTYQSPGGLHGAVDIIAHIGDRIGSSWVCAAQEIRYTIYPVGMPAYPIVNDKLSVNFNMPCDTYQNGQIDALLMQLLYKDDATCNTQGDYDYREFFHILTNSDGDDVYEQSDLNEAWDTSGLPDRSYVIRVTAMDVAGNATADSMVVTTANGNPSAIEELGALDRTRLGCAPNPARGAATISYYLQSEEPVALSLYDVAGRWVRTLAEGNLKAGSHSFRWDGTDSRGAAVAPGAYFYRLSGSGPAIVRRLILVR